MIRLEKVSARVGDFTVEDVSFEVSQGSYGIVIGPTGAGFAGSAHETAAFTAFVDVANPPGPPPCDTPGK